MDTRQLSHLFFSFFFPFSFLSLDLEKACSRYKIELFNDLLSTFLSFENFEKRIKCTL